LIKLYILPTYPTSQKLTFKEGNNDNYLTENNNIIFDTNIMILSHKIALNMYLNKEDYKKIHY